MNYPLGAEHDPAAPWNDTEKYKYCFNGCNLEPHEQEDPMIIDGEVYCDRCGDRLMTLKLYDPVSYKTKQLHI